jgi:hypothetical protein
MNNLNASVRLLLNQSKFPALALVLAVAGCSSVSPPAPPNVGQYSCLEIPSGFEGPGTIIRRDTSGRLFLAYNLLSEPTLRDSVYTVTNVQTAAATRTGTDAANLTIGLLQQLVPGVNVSLNAQAQQQWTGSVTYSGVDEHRTYDAPMHDAARRWMRTANRVPGSEYFLIRDALSARSMTMELSAQQAANLGLEGTIQQAATGRVGVSLTGGATYRLTSEFPAPLFVCITRERVLEAIAIAPPGAAGAPGIAPAAGSLPFQRLIDSTSLPPTRLDSPR